MRSMFNAGTLCNRSVAVVGRETTIADAARRMREDHVGSLVVIDASETGPQVVGLLTDRDIVTAVVAQEMDPATFCVEDVMVSEVVTAGEQDSLMDLLATMRREGLRRIPITQPDGVLLGMITLDDLLEILADQMRAAVLAVEVHQARGSVTRQ